MKYTDAAALVPADRSHPAVLTKPWAAANTRDEFRLGVEDYAEVNMRELTRWFRKVLGGRWVTAPYVLAVLRLIAKTWKP